MIISWSTIFPVLLFIIVAHILCSGRVAGLLFDYDDDDPKCSDAEEEDASSVVAFRSCNETSLVIDYQLLDVFKGADRGPDIIFELKCADQQPRDYYVEVVPLSGNHTFSIEPPLPFESTCNVTMCYLEKYYHSINLIVKAPATLQLQQDCLKVPEIAATSALMNEMLSSNSLVIIATDDIMYSSAVSYQDDSSGYLMSSAAAATQYLYSSNILPPPSASYVTSDTSAVPVSTFLIAFVPSATQSSSGTTADVVTSSQSASQSNRIPPIPTQLHTESHSFVQSRSYSISLDSSINTTSTISKSIPFDVASKESDQNQPLLYIISVLVTLTMILVIIALLLCVSRIVFTQHRKHSKHDIQDIPPVKVEVEEKCNYSYQISHSPSICTIISPLSPITVNDKTKDVYEIFSFDCFPPPTIFRESTPDPNCHSSLTPEHNHQLDVVVQTSGSLVDSSGGTDICLTIQSTDSSLTNTTVGSSDSVNATDTRTAAPPNKEPPLGNNTSEGDDCSSFTSISLDGMSTAIPVVIEPTITVNRSGRQRLFSIDIKDNCDNDDSYIHHTIDNGDTGDTL